MRADELVDQLHEGSDRYAGRSAAAAGRLRASVLAEFAEVGLPAAAVPYVVEVLRTELNPEVVAAAALAVRGWPGSDPELAAALVQAVVNLRGRDGPVGPGTSRTALVEVLAALAWQPSVPAEVVAALERLSREHGVGLEPGGSSGAGRHTGCVAGSGRAGPAGLVGGVRGRGARTVGRGW